MRLTLRLLAWNEIDGCRHDVPRLPIDRFDAVYAIEPVPERPRMSRQTHFKAFATGRKLLRYLWFELRRAG